MTWKKDNVVFTAKEFIDRVNKLPNRSNITFIDGLQPLKKIDRYGESKIQKNEQSIKELDETCRLRNLTLVFKMHEDKNLRIRNYGLRRSQGDGYFIGKRIMS